MDIQIFLKAFFALFVIMDSLGNIPFFMASFEKVKENFRDSYIRKVVFLAFILLFLFIAGGEAVLDFFGITMESFKIAGGLILMILGLKSVLGMKFAADKFSKYSVAVVPIATPIIVGPGALTTVLILVQNYGMLITLLAAVLNIMVVWIVLKKIGILYDFLGKQGSEVLSRVMGLILVALAVEFIRTGIEGYFKVFI